ncbi:hypothetical protein V1460_15380 [Streptomyces sp. SCSIO 30461]|uniref:hypothetical protein n=1 Tax=Streptomyces sp. SCSIO 30461 TaxID=3118085 RepID=UPI0030D22C39
MRGVLRRDRLVQRLLVLSFCTVALLTAASGSASATAAPSCRVGVYLADLYDIDPVRDTIGADMWLWALCPTAELDPTRRFEFLNGNNIVQSSHQIRKVGNQYWSQVKVEGTFREHIHIGDYPFDRQSISFLVEDSDLDSQQLVLEPDVANSSYNPDITLDFFRVSGFKVGARIDRYPTTFGDPQLPSGSGSQYSQFVIDVELVRTQFSSFFKETWPVYIVFMLAVISFLIWAEDLKTALTTRFAILGVSVFTLVVNMREAGQSLGGIVGVTLVDRIHWCTLAYVMVAMVTTTYVWRCLDTPDKHRGARRLNLIVAVASTVVYVGVVLSMLMAALVAY